MSAQHTPGPWGVSGTGTDVLARLTRAGGQVIAVMTNRPHAEAEANARLMAAAPEMLEALVALTDYTAGEAMFQRGANGPWQIEDEQLGRLIEASRDAIDKAEGRQP